MPDRPDTDERSQGWRDLGTALPFLTALLLLPPAILLFSASVTVAGAPLIIVYVFGVWAVAIVTAWIVARRLAGADAPEPKQKTDQRGRS